MSHVDLRSFLTQLEREREIVTVEEEVDPDLELAEIHRRVIAAGGPALRFNRVRGHDIPVVTNLFGTRRRVDMAFGPRPEQFVRDAVAATHTLVPPTLSRLWGARKFLRSALDIGMTTRSWGPVTEVVEQPARLDRLPMIKSWPEDGGAFVTLPLVYTEHPDDGRHNLGMYRVQRHSPTTTGMHWQIGKGGGYHHHVAKLRGQPLPVTLFVGGPPALIVSAIAPLPENVPELLLASLLQGSRLDRVSHPSSPHPLVSGCEFAMVGTVSPTEMAPEGPFGDHYGYYSLRHDYPVFRVDTVFHRRDAIWPATVVGKPRQEDAFIGDYLQRLLSPLFPLVMPNVRDLWSYGETGYHALAAAVVEERFRREAMSAALRVLSEGQLALTKFLLVVDQPMDLTDGRAVLEHILARFQPETDVHVIGNMSLDSLDYTGPKLHEGSRGLWLGLGPPIRTLPGDVPADPGPGVAHAAVFCRGCLVVDGKSYEADPTWARTMAAAGSPFPLVVLVDDAQRTASSTTRFLWTVFTRFEPAADIVAAKERIVRNQVVRSGTIVIDARMKPTYPAELHTDPETARRVTDGWGRWFPNGDVPMGDSEGAHLDAP